MLQNILTYIRNLVYQEYSHTAQFCLKKFRCGEPKWH